VVDANDLEEGLILSFVVILFLPSLHACTVHVGNLDNWRDIATHLAANDRTFDSSKQHTSATLLRSLTFLHACRWRFQRAAQAGTELSTANAVQIRE
jgi:hypothetical protein